MVDKPTLRFVVFASRTLYRPAFDKYRAGPDRVDAELIFEGTGSWVLLPGDGEGMKRNQRSKNGYEFYCLDKNELPPPTDKVIFIAQYKHPKGTCLSPWVEETDDGNLTERLRKYPHAIVFSAASSVPLTDERSIWQDKTGFTSINVSSIDAPRPPRGRERMEEIMGIASDSHHMLIVTVFRSRIVVERKDFLTDEKLGEPWVIDLNDAGKFSYARRSKEFGTPQFASGSVVNVVQDVRGVVVTFPSVPGSEGKPRAWDYEVTAHYAVDGLDKVLMQKRVYSPAVCQSPVNEPKTLECIFRKGELIWDADVIIDVRPLSPFGSRGTAILGHVRIESPKARQKRLNEEARRKAAQKSNGKKEGR